MQTCPKCNQQLADGDMYCIACGAPLHATRDQESEAAPSPATPAWPSKTLMQRWVLSAVAALLIIGAGWSVYRFGGNLGAAPAPAPVAETQAQPQTTVIDVADRATADSESNEHAPAQSGTPAPAPGESSAAELEFWQSVNDSNDPAELEAYLSAFPAGKFVPLARIRLKNARREQPPKTARGEPPREAPKHATLPPHTYPEDVQEHSSRSAATNTLDQHPFVGLWAARSEDCGWPRIRFGAGSLQYESGRLDDSRWCSGIQITKDKGTYKLSARCPFKDGWSYSWRGRRYAIPELPAGVFTLRAKRGRLVGTSADGRHLSLFKCR